MAALRAVLLDLDGTLVDSNDAHAQAWVDVLAEFSHRVEFERVKPLIGMGGDKLLPEVTGISEESEEGGRITKRRKTILMERYMPRLKAFPDAENLIRRMHEQGLRLVVATSANTAEMKELVRIAGIGRYLHEATSSSEANNSKPDPDIISAALAKAGCTPNEAIMLGDTPYDVTAASRAGVRTVALRCGGTPDAKLKGAIAIFDDPHDLLTRYAESPFAGH